MNTKEYKNLANEIINISKKKGADTVEISLYFGEKFSTSVREGNIETLTESESSSLNLEITKDKRKATVNSNDLREESLIKLIDDAVNLTKYTEKDEYLSLPPLEEIGISDIPLEIFDPKINSLSSEEKINLAIDLERKALNLDNRLHTETSDFISNRILRVFANSYGFCEEYLKTNFVHGISLFVEDISSGENKKRKQTDDWYSMNVFFDKLDTIEIIAEKAVNYTLQKIGSRKPKTEMLPVVFSPRMGAAFLSSFIESASGSKIYKKQSFLFDKSNEKIGSNLLNIIDNPLLPAKLGSRPFDAEGVKSRKNIIFENGILRNFMLDNYSANKLGLRTNGNAGGPGNLYLERGDLMPEEILASVKKGIYLTFMSGMGINLITGDYSRGGQGFWIENGKITYPVSEFTLTGNLNEMLKKITMVGNDLEFLFNINTPTFKIENLTISGI